MTVFITHAPDDAEAAAAVETFLERRGHFVHREDGSQGFGPLTRSDVVVMLWSTKALLMSHRIMMERRALDAWAEGRLVLVKLDHGIMPVGLRDLKAIEATFEPQRNIAFAAVNKAIQDAMADARRLEGELARVEAPQARSPMAVYDLAPKARTVSNGGLWAWVLIGLLLLGVALGAASLLAGVSLMLWAVVSGAVAICALAAVVAVSAATARQDEVRRKRAASGPTAGSAVPAPPAAEEAEVGEAGGVVFVSYAQADAALVSPVVEDLKGAGQPVWIDRDGIVPEEGWVGEIVRAIRAAERVCVMCSKAAFESDRVKREVYLADRYRRPLTPLFLDDAAPPSDFEYLFAGLQHLKLTDLPAEGRGAALAQALTVR
jgi:hypothetical protein